MPRGSSSSAQPSSPAHGGPTQFSPWDERCRGVAASYRSEGKLHFSCVVPYEPPVISAACPHPRSSCVCWGRHHHHRRHDLASCLRNRLHHLYLGRRPPVHRSRHQYQHRRQLLASFEACPPPEPPAPPAVFLATLAPSASSMPSSSEVSSSP